MEKNYPNGGEGTDPLATSAHCPPSHYNISRIT